MKNKEGFDNPNYRALDMNTDQYCRIAGALNPSSTDTAGRAELLAIFKNGFGGKTGLDAIKGYLTDMYNKAIDPSKDVNVSETKGGRKESWDKCFGIPIRDAAVVSTDRFGESNIIHSTNPSYTVPTNPGASPAYCMFEVGAIDKRNPWKAGYWETYAPPLGNCVYWMWGTPDGYGLRPANEAFSFYYTFVNSGPPLTATLAGAVDNFGYVVLNGKKYPEVNPYEKYGYEGFLQWIPPFQVTIPTGPNTVEIRCVNTGMAWPPDMNETTPNPAGCWLTITANNNIIVRTNCDGWRCSKFSYPKEVYQISGYIYSQDQAAGMCQTLGADVATYAQLDEAQKAGANWCSTGWVKDKGNRNAFYPITYQTEQGCGNGQSGIIDWIGDNNWFQGTNVPGYSAAINCFGNKPANDAWNKLSPSISIGDKGRLNGTVPGGSVLPFHKDKWSRYSIPSDSKTYPAATTPQCTPASSRQKVVVSNNGTVSCDTYCRGVGGHSWNAEMPAEWNGAKCVGSSDSRYGCKGVPGAVNGAYCEKGKDKGDGNGSCPQSCTCEATGTGWYQGGPAYGT